MRNLHLINSWKINEVNFFVSLKLTEFSFVAMGIDPLASTYKWLERALNRLKTKETIGLYQPPADTTASSQIESPSAILNEAYCELLLWNPKCPFPEVNILERIRPTISRLN